MKQKMPSAKSPSRRTPRNSAKAKSQGAGSLVYSKEEVPAQKAGNNGSWESSPVPKKCSAAVARKPPADNDDKSITEPEASPCPPKEAALVARLPP